MFHWICPECGREIAPTVRECSVCDPAADSEELVHAGVVEAPARTAIENPASAIPANGSPAILTESPALEPAVVQTASIDTKTAEKHGRSRGKNGTTRSFFLRRPATVSALVAPEAPVEEPSHSTIESETRPAEGAPVEHNREQVGHGDPVPCGDAPEIVEAPLAESESAMSGAAQTQAGTPGVSEAVAIPVTHSPQPLPLAPSFDDLEPILPVLDRFTARSSLDSMVAAMGLLPDGESLDDEPAAPDPPMQGAVPLAGVRSVPPAVHLLIQELRPHPVGGSTKPSVVDAPQQERSPWFPPMQARIEITLRPARPVLTPVATGVRPGRLAQGRIVPPKSAKPYAAPPIARMTKYSPLANNPLRPRQLKESKPQADSDFRITLAGPMLTPKLVRFSERELTAVFPDGRRYQKRNLSSWMLAAALGASTIFAGYSGVFSAFIPRSNADTRTETPMEAAMTRTTGTNPISRSVEVTGFRVLMDPSKKSEIQYLVVNHSGEKLSDAVVYVTLYAANAKAGDAPLCKFNFLAPDLGPYQSREMSSSIERVNRPVAVPDWQGLRAEVEVRP